MTCFFSTPPSYVYDPFGYQARDGWTPDWDPFGYLKPPFETDKSPSISGSNPAPLTWRDALGLNDDHSQTGQGINDAKDDAPLLAIKSDNAPRPQSSQANFKPARSTDKAEKYAAGLGTQAKYHGNIELGNQVNEHLIALNSRGVPMPPKVEIDNTAFKGRTGDHAQYHPGLHTITVNPDSDYWKNAAKWAVRLGADKVWSTGSRLHVIVHEIAHWLRHVTAPDRFADLQNLSFTDSQKNLIGGEVSRQATLNPYEFVAEVYAGIAHGKKYPEQIMQMYNNFGGPRL